MQTCQRWLEKLHMRHQREGRGDYLGKTNPNSLGCEGKSGATAYSEESIGDSINTKQCKRNPPLPPARRSNEAKTKAKNANVTRLRQRSKPPRSREKGVMVRGDGGDTNDVNGGLEMGDSRENGASLLLQLRQASNEVEGLRKDTAADARERLAWQQRDDYLCLRLANLGSRCEALERNLREESHAADIEAARAKSAEDRFQKLLGWARKEEERRRQAEEGLARVSEEGRALEARIKVADEELIGSKRQLDTRRFQLEGALEDLRRRTAENERVEEQAKLMRGELVALRELTDTRGSEVKELRERVASLVEEAKCISSENVKVRKQLGGERERWRATERSKTKQDQRRQMEVERKAEDMHALRYRVQELEARLSSETARRRGAEEDARRSQQIERRSMEELLETRDTDHPRRPGRGSRSYPADQSAPRDSGAALSANSIWHSWEDARDTVTAAPPPSAGPSWITGETVANHGGMSSSPYPLPWEQHSRKQRDSITSATPSPHPFETSPSHVSPTAAWTPSASLSRRWDTPPVEGAMELTVAPTKPSSCPRRLSRSPEVLLYDSPRQRRPRPRQPPTEDCGDVDGVNKARSGFQEEQKSDHGHRSEEGDGGNDLEQSIRRERLAQRDFLV